MGKMGNGALDLLRARVLGRNFLPSGKTATQGRTFKAVRLRGRGALRRAFEARASRGAARTLQQCLTTRLCRQDLIQARPSRRGVHRRDNLKVFGLRRLAVALTCQSRQAGAPPPSERGLARRQATAPRKRRQACALPKPPLRGGSADFEIVLESPGRTRTAADGGRVFPRFPASFRSRLLARIQRFRPTGEEDGRISLPLPSPSSSPSRSGRRWACPGRAKD